MGSWVGDAYCHLSSNCTMGLFDCWGFVRADWINTRFLNLDGLSMSEMSKQQALDWLVINVKKWPTREEGKRPIAPEKTVWHSDVATDSWMLYVSLGENESAFIAEGDWAIEKKRIAAEKRKRRNARFKQGKKENGCVRWNGYIPNSPEAKAKMTNLAAKLREKK